MSSYKKELAFLVIASTLFISGVLASIWIERIDTWCAHPERSGNWIVQPYCQK